MFYIEICDAKGNSNRRPTYVELVSGSTVICDWECLPDRYRYWTSDEADVFIMWEQDRAISQGVRLVKRGA